MNRPINESVQNALGKMGVNYPKQKEVTYGIEIVVEGADAAEVAHLRAVAERTGRLNLVEEDSDRVRVRFLFEDKFIANRFLDFAKARSKVQEGMRARKSMHPRMIMEHDDKSSKDDAEYVSKTSSDKKCSGCTYFESGSCTKVTGKIAPEGWCKYWKE